MTSSAGAESVGSAEVSLVLVSEERARDFPKPPVYVLGVGEGDLRVASVGARREVHLDGGEMLFDVVPLGPDESFVVVTPHLRARVVGTVFAVRVDDAGSAVEVYEGQEKDDR